MCKRGLFPIVLFCGVLENQTGQGEAEYGGDVGHCATLAQCTGQRITLDLPELCNPYVRLLQMERF